MCLDQRPMWAPYSFPTVLAPENPGNNFVIVLYLFLEFTKFVMSIGHFWYNVGDSRGTVWVLDYDIGILEI